MTQIAESTQLLTPGANRPGHKLTGFHAFVVHETANENPLADAAMHRRYWQPGGSGRTISSVHFVADSATSIQLLPTDEIGWHLGDGANQPLTDESFFTVAIEICVNSRAGFPSACARAAKIVSRVLTEKGVQPTDGVTLRKHGSYPSTTHKTCPAHLNKGDWGVTWAQFVGMVKAEYAKVIVPTQRDYSALWGHYFPYFAESGIAAKWRDHATVLGAAVSDETSDKEGRIWRLFHGGAVSYLAGKTDVYLPRKS